MDCIEIYIKIRKIFWYIHPLPLTCILYLSSPTLLTYSWHSLVNILILKVHAKFHSGLYIKNMGNRKSVVLIASLRSPQKSQLWKLCAVSQSPHQHPTPGHSEECPYPSCLRSLAKNFFSWLWNSCMPLVPILGEEKGKEESKHYR